MGILSESTIVGNVGSVYELRTVGRDNREVIDFSVAITPRVRDGEDWKDGTTQWVTVTAWNKLAKHISESFNKGDRVFVKGRVEMKDGYTNKDGVEVPARPNLVAEFAGLEVSYHPATSSRVSNGGGNRDRGQSSSGGGRQASAQQNKPAASISDDDLELDFSLDANDSEDTPF